MKFRTPVACQNLHRAFWYWETDEKDIGHVTHYGVPDNQKCSCPKQGLGEGYIRAGRDQMFAGVTDKNTGKDIYEGDLVLASYHWTEAHEIELPSDYYDFSEFALSDDLVVIGNVLVDWDIHNLRRVGK